MHSRRLTQRAIPATVALAFALANGAVLAQNNGSPEMQSPGTPTIVTIDHDLRTGIANQELQLSENISYADLNLASPAGKDELKTRVRDAANNVCERLSKADPDPGATAASRQEDETNCVNNAIDGAMTQIRRAQATPESPRNRR
jgi:UrcA family protein